MATTEPQTVYFSSMKLLQNHYLLFDSVFYSLPTLYPGTGFEPRTFSLIVPNTRATEPFLFLLHFAS